MFKPTHIIIIRGIETLVDRRGQECFNDSDEIAFKIDDQGKWYLPDGELVWPCPKRSNAQVIRLGPPGNIKKGAHHKHMPVGAQIKLTKLPDGRWSAVCEFEGLKTTLPSVSSVIGGVNKICKEWIRDYIKASRV